MVSLLKKPRFICAVAALLFISSLPASAQSAEMIDKAKEVQNLLSSGKLVQARPLMEELLPAAESGEFEAEIGAKLQFFIGLSYVVEYFDTSGGPAILATAKTKLEEFIQKYPNDENVPVARLNLGDIEATNGNFEEALKFYIPLYNNPTKNVESDDVLKKIVMLYAASEQWVAGIPYFSASMNNSRDATDRTTAAAYMIIGQAQSDSLENLDEALEFLQTPSPVFFSTRFNLALMNVADKLKEQEDLAMANLFYQFIRDYETLKDGLTRYIDAFERTVLRFEGNSFRRNEYMSAKAQLDNAQADLKALSTIESYTPILKWKIAQCLMGMGRDWEAFWLFHRMAEVYPNHENAEDILYLAYNLAHKLNSYEMMENLARRYLENMQYLKYRGTIATQLGEFYVDRGDFHKLYQLTKDYLELAPADDEGSPIVLFTHGMMRLGRHEIAELIADFTRYDQVYGSTISGTVIHYFLGLGFLLEQEHQLAIDNLNEVLKNSRSKFTPDAEFRKALALMGLDKIQEARQQLEKFISSYPNNALRSTAELTLGSVVDMLGDMPTALKHYYRVAEHTSDPGLIGSAEVKISRILVFQRKLEEAINRLQAYLEAYGESPDSIPASEELVNLLNREERQRQALVVLEQQVNRFIDEIRVGEIDPMLVTYIRQDRRLREIREKTREFFNVVSQDAELLEQLVRDRAVQFRYFRKHNLIDVAVKDAFTYDNDFRAEIIAELDLLRPPPPPPPPVDPNRKGPPPPAPEPEPIDLTGKTIKALVDLQKTIERANESIPEEPVDVTLKAAIQKAREMNNMPLVIRIETAFAHTQEPRERPTPQQFALIEDRELWMELAHASQMWILEEISKYDAPRVIEELNLLRPQLVATNSELEMYQILAKCYESTDAKALALESYQDIIKKFGSRNAAADAILEAGRLMIEMGRQAEARETLQGILYRPDWIGAKHAQALLWIGKSYNAERKYAEAHGFFERVMLGYPGQNEEVAEAYYQDLKTLKLMGENASVQTVYQAFMESPGLQETKAGKKIKEEFNL